jgi:hypothetical protein
LVDFFQSFCSDIAQLSGLDMRIPLSNHLLGVIEISGGNCVPERTNENFAHSTATTVRCKIVMFRVVDIDLCGL